MYFNHILSHTHITYMYICIYIYEYILIYTNAHVIHMCIRYTGPPMSLTQTHGLRSYFRIHLSGSKGQSMGNLGIESTSHLKGSPFLNPTRCLNC